MQIVAANKTDIYDAHENVQRLHEYLDPLGIEIFEVSAATRQGFTPLLKRIAQVLPTLPEPASMEDLPEETLDEKTLGEQFTIYREHGEFFVDGPGAQRLIDSVNFDDEESVNWFHKTLRRMGIIDRLREAGAKEGDTIVFADMEFDFVE